MEDLGRAARALSEGDYDLALTVLLAAWDETRSPELAAAIEQVSARVTGQLPAVGNDVQRKALTEWVELARQRRPQDVGRLMAALVKVYGDGPAHMVRPRLDEVLQMPPDPRIGRALIEAYAGQLQGWSQANLLRTVNGLARHGDASMSEPLAAALRMPRAAYIHSFLGPADLQRFEKLRDAWSQRGALVAPPGLDAVLAALTTAPSPVAARPASEGDGDALLAAIFADPFDAALRAVYADHLSAAGDPRGELIVLQLDRAQGRGSPAKTKREKALIKAHASKWLGGLAGEIVMNATEWEGGFPVSTRTKMVRLSQVEASVVRREWSTFRRIEFDGPALLSETMRGLEEVYGLTDKAVLRAKKDSALPPHLRSVELLPDYRVLAVDDPVIAALLAMPSLRSLCLRRDHATPVEMTPPVVARLCDALGDRLEHLALIGGAFSLGETVALFIEGGGGSALRSFRWGWQRTKTQTVDVTVRRDDAGRWSTIELRLDVAPTGEERSLVLRRLLGPVAGHRFELARVSGGPEWEQLAAALAGRVEKLQG